MKKTLLALAAFASFSAAAEWHLNQQHSAVTFTTFKKQHIAENHHFDRIQGIVADSGKAQLTIDLSSVNTSIPIRDSRMKEHLFNVDVFTSATFNTQLPADFMSKMSSGETKQTTLSGSISLHGQEQQVTVKALVTKVSDKKIVVNSIAPLLLKASDFALVDGVNKLQELAGLPSISHTVPVNFSLVFSQ